MLYSPKSINCSARLLPASLANRLGLSIRRVVLLANNPAISSALLDGVLDDGDLLVTFDRNDGLSLLSTRNNPRLFCFGAATAGAPEARLPSDDDLDEIVRQAGQPACGMLFIGEVPEALAAEVASYRLLNDHGRWLQLDLRHPAWADYPQADAAMPSTEFMVYRLFAALRHSRQYARLRPFEIVLLGFNWPEDGNETGPNRAFEKAEMARGGAQHIPAHAVRSPVAVPERRQRFTSSADGSAWRFVATLAPGGKQPLAHFIDSIKVCHATQAGWQLKFDMVLVYDDACVEGFILLPDQGAPCVLGVAEYPDMQKGSPRVGSQFPELAWSGRSRFHFDLKLEAPEASALSLHARCGSELRLVGKIQKLPG